MKISPVDSKRSFKCCYSSSLNHLKSILAFTDKSVQVSDKAGQDVLADS